MTFDTNPNQEKLLKTPYDQFQRYRIISDIILQFKKINNLKKMRIIDVGANKEGHLKYFLPEDDVYFLDQDYPVEILADSHYINGDATKMSFDDNDFDLAVSTDVLEHIPIPKRNIFLNELYRVGKYGFVLGAPFDTNSTTSFEILFNEYFKIIHGQNHPWLEEHINYGLPQLEEILSTIKDNITKHVAVYPNAYLSRWLLMFSVDFAFASHPTALKYITMLNYYYNKTFYDDDNREPCYRYVITAFKSKCEISLPTPKKSINLEENENILHIMINNLGECLKQQGEETLRQEHHRLIQQHHELGQAHQNLINDHNQLAQEHNNLVQEHNNLVQEHQALQQSKAVLIARELGKYTFLVRLFSTGYRFLAKIYRLFKR